MASNSFSVDYDAARNVVRYRIAGFWDVATVDTFIAALTAEIARHGTGGRKPSLLGDAREFAVQSAPVAQAFEAAMLTSVLPRVERLALVVAAMLNKLQVERGVGESRTAVFLSEDEALAWLRDTA